MNDPKKHHYVPEVYLQRFAINQSGDLYKLKVKPKKKENRPRLINKSQVCYEPNMYRYIHEAFIVANNLEDPNYIEKNLFPYEVSELSILFDKIDSNSKIFKSEYKRVIQIIFSIKKRNPSIRKIYLEGDRDEEFMDSRIKGITQKLLSIGIQEEEIKIVISKVKKEVLQQLKDENARKDMYKNSILMSNDEIIKKEEDVINELLKWTPLIYRTSYELPFITSDNPGFSRKNGIEFYNTSFASVDELFFPISPKTALVLRRDKLVGNLLLYQNIKVNKATLDMVSIYNAGTFHNCNNIILGNTEEQLIITSEYN